ncbi:MAG: hypothetical protein NT005_18355 [Spirochaetes bacterium]|nr:hypothetical protein [Spirochaetota bacterium]
MVAAAKAIARELDLTEALKEKQSLVKQQTARGASSAPTRR